mmetsp:Transcript_3544/g.5144  ORF Transcript_3544/g.5144 Transcript_3544/m.5144 type:complete len:387 (-) Transcript_3544:170-1330(-)
METIARERTSSRIAAGILTAIVLATCNFLVTNNAIGKDRSNAMQQGTMIQIDFAQEYLTGKNIENNITRADDISDALLTSNSSEYTWIENHFLPPKGVPVFHPEDYSLYFQKRNTLFIGDSTGRRAYATLFAIMNSTGYYSNISSIPTKDLVNPDVIDFNKDGRRKEKCLIQHRSLHRLKTTWGEFVCRNISKDMSSHHHHHQRLFVDKSNAGAKFDYLKINCMKELVPIFSKEDGKKHRTSSINEALMDYDLIIIAMGLHDALMVPECSAQPISNSHDLDLVLDALSSVTSPELQILFRTPGFHANHIGDNLVWDLIHHSKEYANRLSTATNFTVLDWGTVISKRSFGEDRIHGDMLAHYGLEARLLFGQQLLHELFALDLKKHS